MSIAYSCIIADKIVINILLKIHWLNISHQNIMVYSPRVPDKHQLVHAGMVSIDIFLLSNWFKF